MCPPRATAAGPDTRPPPTNRPGICPIPPNVGRRLQPRSWEGTPSSGRTLQNTLENTSEARSGVSLIWLGPGACVIKSQEYARLMGREVSDSMMEEAYAWTVPDT